MTDTKAPEAETTKKSEKDLDERTLKQQSWMAVARALSETDWYEGRTDAYIAAKVIEQIVPLETRPSKWKELSEDQRIAIVDAPHTLVVNEAARITIKKAFEKGFDAKRIKPEPSLVEIMPAFGLV